MYVLKEKECDAVRRRQPRRSVTIEQQLERAVPSLLSGHLIVSKIGCEDLVMLALHSQSPHSLTETVQENVLEGCCLYGAAPKLA